MHAWHRSVWLVLLQCGLALQLDDARRQPESIQGWKGKRGFAEEGNDCWDANVWGDTPYPLTQKMCRRSHIHHGDVKTSGALLSKLHHGECVRVAVLGGSVSAGRCTTCPGKNQPDGVAWPAQLKKWLDARFPCNGPQGHIVDNYSHFKAGSEIQVAHLHEWRDDPAHRFWSADMVVIETAADDYGGYHGWGDWGLENAKDLTNIQRIRSFTEVLARELTQSPKKPWLLWAELGWRNVEPTSPDRTDANMWHLPILQYYDIDQVSMIDAFLPLSTATRRDWLRDNFFADESNPNPLGHQMCAQVVAHAMMHNSHLMNLALPDRRSWFNRESSDVEPPPLELSYAASGIYASGRAERYTFTSGDRAKMQEYILSQDGFAMADDPDAAGRAGLLAAEPESRVQIGVPLPRTSRSRTHTRFQLGLLKSYEHMGVARIKYGVVPQACSTSLFTKTKFSVTPDIDCLWDVLASTRQVEEFVLDRPEGQDTCLLLEIEVRSATPPRKENKVKVLDLHVM